MRLYLGVVQLHRIIPRPAAQRRYPPLPDIKQIFQPDWVKRNLIEPIDNLGSILARGRLRGVSWGLRLGHTLWWRKPAVTASKILSRQRSKHRESSDFREARRHPFPSPRSLPKNTAKSPLQEPVMITLYGVYRSRASRPLWLLAELGLPFTHIPVIQGYRLTDPKAADAPLNTTSASYLQVNPQGQIPAYTEDGLVLTESLAITLHIARSHGGAFGPQTNAEAALMEQWSLFAATSVETPALEILYIIGDGGDKTPEGQASIAVNAEKLRRPLSRLAAHLSAHDWLVGDRFTAADINVAEIVRYAQSHPTLLGEFPSLQAWLERCQSRPGFKAMWQARAAEPA